MWICGGGYTEKWLVCGRMRRVLYIIKSVYSLLNRYTMTDTTATSVDFPLHIDVVRWTLRKKLIVQDFAGWHCVGLWRHTVRSSITDSFNLRLSIAVTQCPEPRSAMC
jgi:hypothetical protein